MDKIKLVIYHDANGQSVVRATANRWVFHDTMMGEQYIELTIKSEVPIPFAVGDYCLFRGETFTLNYKPSVRQDAGLRERQDSYVYENIKFDSRNEELTRCLMLDVAPAGTDYDDTAGTNYTGSSQFQLYCGETEESGEVRTAVCVLADKIKSNLDRLYTGYAEWAIEVNTENTHTEDKLLSFDNMTAAQALSEVKNTFNLNYSVKGRTIYIGYSLEDVTGEDSFEFGYGKGYPTPLSQGKALTRIKRDADSQQMIVTRLRVLGSTKNLPYRYYNDKYNLSQALFPTNLQLPGTFLPLGTSEDAADPNGSTKWARNKARSSSLRKVLGNTNDAYIDKGDDAAACAEGIREASVRFDGSGDTEEIYPTIEGVTYGELRDSGIPDMDNGTGSSSFPNYTDSDTIDKLLGVGRMSNGTIVDDANVGNGILDNGEGFVSSAYLCRLAKNGYPYNQFTNAGSYYKGVERELFTVRSVGAGSYAMAPTYGKVYYFFHFDQLQSSADVGFLLQVKKKVGSITSVLGTYISDFVHKQGVTDSYIELPSIPDAEDMADAQIESIDVDGNCDIVVTFTPIIKNVTDSSLILVYRVGAPEGESYEPKYNWIDSANGSANDGIFHVFLKDMGFALSAVQNGETAKLAMKSGNCIGREFEISSVNTDVTISGKRGTMISLKRAKDNSLNTYYPSAINPIAAGDKFVLLNINMPDAFIATAEVRLLAAATEYLAKHCDTQFIYEPSLDDIYLQRNYDNLKAQDKEDESVFWRLYAGLKFSFRGIPNSANELLPSESVTIEKVSITMGDGLTPKVELKLNDDPKQTTLQKALSNANKGIVEVKEGASSGASERDHYIGTTKAQTESKPQGLTGIEKIQFSVPDGGEIGLEVREIEGRRTLHTTMPVKTDGAVMAKSLEVGANGDYGIGQNGDAVLHDAALHDVELNNAEFTGDAQTDNFADVAGQITGAQITHAGKITASAIKALSFEIFELIYNRIRTTGGRQSFTSAAGTVEEVIPLTTSNYSQYISGDYNQNCYVLKMRSDEDRLDDKTEFANGDIFYSYVNAVGQSGSYAHGGQCWMHVIDVNTSGDNNYIVAQMYGSPVSESGVVKYYTNAYTHRSETHHLPVPINLVPTDGMTITHWGNVGNSDRQTTFYIDCEDGNMLQLMGVDEPQISYANGNYGSIIGKLPQEIINAVRTKTGYVLNANQPYTYARGVVAQDFIQLDYEGKILRQERKRGEWSYATATGDSPYVSKANMYDTVTHNGCLYMCMQSDTTSEPGTDGEWMLVSGAELKMYDLLVEPNAITIKADGTITPDTNISVKVKKSVAGKPMEILDYQSDIEAEGLRVEYSFDGSVWAEFTIGENGLLSSEAGATIITEDVSDPATIILEGGGFDISSLPSNSRLSIRLVRDDDDVVISVVDVPITKDGEKGEEGTTFSVKGEAYIDPNGTHSWKEGEYLYDPGASLPGAAILICTQDGVTPSTTVVVTTGDAYIIRDTEIEGHMIYYNGTIWVDLGNITGRGIRELVTEYAVSSSTYAAPSSGWSATRPTLTKTNPYLWQRVKVVYTDGTESSWSEPVVIGSLAKDARTLYIDRQIISVLVDATSGKTIGTTTGNVIVRYMDGETPVSFSANDATITDGSGGSVSALISKSVSGNTMTLTYSIPADTDSSLLPACINISVTPVDYPTISQKVELAQSQRGTVGPMGEAGPLMYPAGVYDEATAKQGYNANGYYNDGVSTPYVYYIAPNAEEGNYYYRTQNKYHNANGSVIDDPTAQGTQYDPTDPATEYLFSNPAWRVITKYESVWAKILFANFGRLSEFVFWGKWMFSVWGEYTDPLTGVVSQDEYAGHMDEIETALTDGTSQVGDFKNCDWIPNFYANSDTGEVHMGNAVVNGNISTPMVQVENSVTLQQLSLASGYNIAVRPRTWYYGSVQKFAPLLLTLPMADDWKIDGTEAEIVVEFCSAINGLAGDGETIWKSSVMVCADDRFLSPLHWDEGATLFSWGTINTISNVADYNGFFSWNGKLCKCVILKYGQILKLKLVRTLVYQTNGDTSYVNLWYIVNASDFIPIENHLLIPDDITGGVGDTTLSLTSLTGVGPNGEILAICVGPTELNDQSYAIGYTQGELEFGTSGSYQPQ